MGGKGLPAIAEKKILDSVVVTGMKTFDWKVYMTNLSMSVKVSWEGGGQVCWRRSFLELNISFMQVSPGQ